MTEPTRDTAEGPIPQDPFFSIVLPFYNAGSYIGECIAALRAQTFGDFEVIGLDDGSPDDSATAWSEAVEGDDRFRLLSSSENHGVSFQRNRGLEAARGDFVLFFDADDTVAKRTLSQVRKAIERDDADIVVFGGDASPRSAWVDEKMSPQRATLRDRPIEALMDEPGSRPFMCNKAYRRTTLIDHGCRFDEALALGEDQVFQFTAFPYARTVSFIPDKLYHYRMDNADSAMARAASDAEGKACKHVDLVGSVVRQWHERGLLDEGANRATIGNWAIGYLFDGVMSLPDAKLRERGAIICGWFSNEALSEEALLPENQARLTCLRALASLEAASQAAPRVSVIMPMYNAERFLGQALASLRAQTFPAFEAILVDDGSSDGTLDIAERFIRLDSRFRLLRQEHRFAGEARNKGIDAAQGEYLLFLDADDWFDLDLVEKALARAERFDADICCYRARAFDMASDEVRDLPWTCKTHLVPADEAFSGATAPDSIFCFTTPAPWSKLFRASFVREKSLRFQATRSANDMRFVMTALAEAERIVASDDVLLTYRINAGDSLQSTQDKDPLAFYEALLALRAELGERSAFPPVEGAYVNFALDYCLYNLGTMKSREAFDRVYRLLVDEAFCELGITKAAPESFHGYSPDNYERMQFMQGHSPADYRKRFRAHRIGQRTRGCLARARRKLRSMLPAR